MSSPPESNLAKAASQSVAIPRSLSLKTKITGVMLLTVSAIAAIVHFPWAYTSRQNVDDMVSQINSELMNSTENEVGHLFENILSSKQLITSSLDEGLIQLDDPEVQGRFYLNLLKANENFTWVQFAFANGDYLGAQRRSDGLYNLIQRQWDDTLGAQAEPGSELAEVQAKRAEIADQYLQDQRLPADFETADKTVRTYQFQANNDWQILEESTGKEFYYAPIRPFYRDAFEQPDENVWTDLYVFKTGNAVGLDAATTYREAEDSPIRGVISISFELQQISQYLDELKDDGEGAIFITDSQGSVIASSNPLALSETFVGEGTNADAELLPLGQVEDPLLQVAYQAFRTNNIELNQLIGLQELTFYDSTTRQRYYIAVQPLGQLDWVVGTVTPESVFLTRINRSRNRLLIVITAFLGVGAIAAVWLSDRAITRPIMNISDAAEAIESGTFTKVSLDETINRRDELGKLARVFEKMAQEVYNREQNLKRQLQALKIEIDESRKSREVKEIVETDFFKDLKIKAQHMRERRHHNSFDKSSKEDA
ncbi:HAMP domain-containing protein [Leptolyngbya iicbica]|uniref:histidine kinase n=2 Tax=Cyanophyceae TaxID=3028117 RepID=A0A4Q7E3N3_9CYAN|nr:HAMP domain-containing protein [Leptolyngbya sp. LK]RZM76612.1 HAMP domain-containing protein [Leptolyngbya sp. LK]